MDIARGIDKMHSRRLVHLDLKSPNVLLSASGTAKIAVRTCPALARSQTPRYFLMLWSSIDCAMTLGVVCCSSHLDQACFWSMGLQFTPSAALRGVAALQGTKYKPPSSPPWWQPKHADDIPAVASTL